MSVVAVKAAARDMQAAFETMWQRTLKRERRGGREGGNRLAAGKLAVEQDLSSVFTQVGERAPLPH